MKKINLCLVLILICLFGGLVAFIFPFYKAEMDGIYGEMSVAGKIGISGISLLFGLGTTGSGYYADKSFDVRQNFGPLPLAALIVGAILFLLILLIIRRRANYVYFAFSCLFIAIGAGMMVLAFYNRELCQITLSNKEIYPEFKREYLGMGINLVLCAAAGVVFFGVMELICVYLAIRKARPQILDPYGYDEYGNPLDPSLRIGQQQGPVALLSYGDMVQDGYDTCENELNILKDLFENGMISQQEYDAKREEILNKHFTEM